MKGITKEEFRRAFRSRRFGAAVLLGLIFLLVGVYTRLFSNQALPKAYSFADLWFYIYTYSHYALALPLSAVIPFSDALAAERAEGFLKPLVFRSGFRSYVWNKFIVNAAVAAAAAMLPLVGLYLFTNLYVPRQLYPINVWDMQVAGRPGDLLRPFFQNAPDLFILFLTGMVGLMSALYATFAMSLSFVTTNRYWVLGVPCALYLFSHFVAVKTNLFGPDWSPVAPIYGNSWHESAWGRTFLTHPLALAALIAAILILFCCRERVLS